jgi:hypothetical protein
MHAWNTPTEPDPRSPEREVPDTPDAPGTPERRPPGGSDPDVQRAPGDGEEDTGTPPPMQAFPRKAPGRGGPSRTS